LETGFGIDIGGSGIKGAPVDLSTGQLLTERCRIATPQPATPLAVSGTVAEIVEMFQWNGPIGCTIPAVVQKGVVHNATNIDKTWIGVSAEEMLTERLNRSAKVINDADAAGLAEMKFGAGAGYSEGKVVLMLTFGTGIGSTLFVNGQQVPNMELGDLELDGHNAEQHAAGRLREEDLVSWSEWTSRVERYLQHVENLFWPDLIIFGGGISNLASEFLPHIKTRTLIVPAKLRNNAGITGAALIAQA